MMEIHLDSIGQAIIAFCVLVFLGFTHRNLARIGRENNHIVVWPATYIVRATMLSWTICTVALLIQLLAEKPAIQGAPLATAPPLFLISLLLVSAFSYARIDQRRISCDRDADEVPFEIQRKQSRSFR